MKHDMKQRETYCCVKKKKMMKNKEEAEKNQKSCTDSRMQNCAY